MGKGDFKTVNNLILEHLNFFGYHVEARILEREFSNKNRKVNSKKKCSRLMEFVLKGKSFFNNSYYDTSSEEESRSSASRKSSSSSSSRSSSSEKEESDQEYKKSKSPASYAKPKKKKKKEKKKEKEKKKDRKVVQASQSFSGPIQETVEPVEPEYTNTPQREGEIDFPYLYVGKGRFNLKNVNYTQAYKLGPHGYDDKIPVTRENKKKGSKNNKREEYSSWERVHTSSTDNKSILSSPVIVLNEMDNQGGETPQEVKPWRVNFLNPKQPSEKPRRLVTSSSLRPDSSSTRPTESGDTFRPLVKEYYPQANTGTTTKAFRRVTTNQNTSLDSPITVQDQNFYSENSPYSKSNNSSDFNQAVSNLRHTESFLAKPQDTRYIMESRSSYKRPTFAGESQTPPLNKNLVPKKASFTPFYASSLGEPRRTASVAPHFGSQRPSHASLVNSFLDGEKKYTQPLPRNNNNIGNMSTQIINQRRAPYFPSLDNTSNSSMKGTLYPRNTLLPDAATQGFWKPNQPFIPPSSQNGMGNNDQETAGQGQDAQKQPYYPPAKMRGGFTKENSQNQKKQSLLDRHILEHLLAQTSFKENEIKTFFQIYEFILENTRSPAREMDQRRFQEFLRKTRDVSGELFILCLFKHGSSLGLINREGLISFKDSVIVLDRLNQENPFPIVHFLFQLSVADDPKKASLSLVRDIMKEIRATNTRGKISLLLESFEYLHKHGVGSLAIITFEEYLEIVRNFEPMKKYA